MAAIIAAGGAAGAGLIGIGGYTARSILKSFRDNVGQLIQQTIQSGTNSIMGITAAIGAEIIKDIDHFEEAYRKELDYTVHLMSQEAQLNLYKVGELVSRFTNRVDNSIQSFFGYAETLMLSIPFFQHQTKLTDYGPRFFIVNDLAEKTTVAFNGIFPSASLIDKGNALSEMACNVLGVMCPVSYKPTLVFGATSCSLINSTTTKLEFDVPHAIFRQLPEVKRFSTVTGMLNAPWKETGVLQNSQVNAVYQITFYGLPSVAGTIKQATFQTANSVERVHKVLGWGVNTNQSSGGTQTFYPTSGYQFDLATFRQPPKPPAGPSQVYNGQGIVTPRLTPHGFANHIDIDYRFTYRPQGIIYHFSIDECKHVINPPATRTVGLALKWGESQLLQPANGETLLSFTFEDCRGQTKVFSGPIFDHPVSAILNIQPAMNGGLLLTAKIPTNVTAFMNGEG